MTAVQSIVDAIRNISPADRRIVMAAVAECVAEDSPTAPSVRLSDPSGRTVGLFLPVAQGPRTPPVMTSEEEAELQRCIATIDNSYSTEEMKEFIRQGRPVATPGS